MSVESVDFVQNLFAASEAAHHKFAAAAATTVVQAADAMGSALDQGSKILAFGNGGSASDAQHLVAELIGRFEGERRALPALALTPDSNVVTAIANDYGYDRVFSRQLEGLATEGDVAFGISTSGRSPNVLAAFEAAKAQGLVTIAMTGRDGGPIGAIADIHINVAESSTARVQEVHRTIMHAICSLIELRLRQS
jgi:D-sedoheptulose 7-phosphate isomerase